MRASTSRLRGIAAAIAIGGLAPAVLLAMAHWPTAPKQTARDHTTGQPDSRPPPPARALIERAVRDERQRQAIETLDHRARQAGARPGS